MKRAKAAGRAEYARSLGRSAVGRVKKTVTDSPAVRGAAGLIGGLKSLRKKTASKKKAGRAAAKISKKTRGY